MSTREASNPGVGENDALLIMDEVQAGFGRTGKWFAFEHYGITPDLIACGKGISGSLPLSAVIGRHGDHGAVSPRLHDLHAFGLPAPGRRGGGERESAPARRVPPECPGAGPGAP